MKKSIFILTIIIFSFSYVWADTKDYCHHEWKNDFAMVEYCIQRQDEGNQDFLKLRKKAGIDNLTGEEFVKKARHGEPIPSIFANCLMDWELPDFNTYDWSMVSYCIKRQLEAYERVR